MYTIKRAAELTGISVPTLRAWERRYAIVSPERTESGYRLYDEAALHALSAMNGLVRDGWTPSLAAEEVRRRLDAGELGPAPPGSSSAPGPTGDGMRGPGRLWKERDVEAEAHLQAGRRGPLAALDLVGPAARMDAREVGDVLDDAFSRASFEVVVGGWLMPALRQLGEAWADGRVPVAGEHLVAYAVQRRLAAAFEAAGAPSADARPTAVLGLPPGARHELGLFAFAVAARRLGLRTVYVGADLPADDWIAAVTRHEADAAVLAAATPADVRALRRVVADLRRARPELLIAVGGGQQDSAPSGCLLLGHEIGPAADRLAQALRGAG